jgi:hypothetical protein
MFGAMRVPVHQLYDGLSKATRPTGASGAGGDDDEGGKEKGHGTKGGLHTPWTHREGIGPAERFGPAFGVGEPP